MKELEQVKEKLTKAGYIAYISETQNKPCVRGHEKFDEAIEFPSVVIWVWMNDNKYVFLDIISQSSATEKQFENLDDLMKCITDKYPI